MDYITIVIRPDVFSPNLGVGDSVLQSQPHCLYIPEMQKNNVNTCGLVANSDLGRRRPVSGEKYTLTAWGLFTPHITLLTGHFFTPNMVLW